MKLLLALDDPHTPTTEAQIRHRIPSLGLQTASTADELASLLEAEPYEIVVVADALRAGLDPDSRALLAESNLVVLADQPPSSRTVTCDDFLVVGEDGIPVDELVARILQAQRRVSEVTLERQRQESVARSLQEIIYRLDENGRFTYVNEAVRRLGYEPEELIGRHFTEILESAHGSSVSRDAVLPSLAGTRTGSGEAPGLFDERRRGERRTRNLDVVLRTAGPAVESRFLGVVTASGDVVTRVDGRHELVGTIGVIRDASADVRATDVLRKLFAMADSAPYGVLATDTDLNVDYANPGFYRTFGLTPLQVVTQPVGGIPLPGFDQRLVAHLEDACERGLLYQQDMTLPDENGEDRSYRCTCRPVYNAKQSCTGIVLALVPDDLSVGESGVPDEWMDLPMPLDRSVRGAIETFQGEIDSSLEVTYEGIAEREVPSSLAHLAREVVHDLLEFAFYVTEGGPSQVTLSEQESSIVVHVRAVQSADSGIARTPDTFRLRSLINRSEKLRASVTDRGGSWDTERCENGVEFRVRLPQQLGHGGVEPENRARSFDLDAFAAAYHDSPEIMHEILRLYREEAPVRVAAIRRGIEQADFAEIGKASHSLANTSGTLQSDEAVAYARRLETAAREEDLERCRQEADNLISVVESMVEQIEAAFSG